MYLTALGCVCVCVCVRACVLRLQHHGNECAGRFDFAALPARLENIRLQLNSETEQWITDGIGIPSIQSGSIAVQAL
jgi:hypothetical protein